MTSTAQRVDTPHGQGVVTGRSSDGTTTAMLADGAWKRSAAPRIANGTYRPNVPGARTIAEARPLYVGGEPVTVNVYDGGVALFHGVKIVFEGPMPEGIRSSSDLFRWAADFRPVAA